MIESAAVLGVAAAALAMVLTPGPNMMYLVSRTVAQGRRAGLVSLGGVAAGFAVYLAAATAGLTAVFALVPGLYLAVKLAGAAYLLWLAWRALRPGGASVFEPADLPADPARRLFTMGLVTNLLNPKIAVMYMALIPQFVVPARGHLWLQSLSLGAVQITVALAVNALIVLGAGTLVAFLTRRPAWLRTQRYLMGTALAGVAVALVTDRTRPTPA
ncbi:LysE family translocator [Nocardia farcinica]|uniref:Homoserine/homoserine lactone efflux protein n=1 Tax=Nocardia farcinica TaxID=37329 RepID=A0A0H5NY00_NOCFR|nr:LysE family translocator [Nocardia farcinica]AXK86624.1 LysE family translocator [Nocardia farcinica]MBA4859009.1 LysE family translocator [Nocardia farcinica]MBC9819337.1 LysE family translocator [Nocardia farcinica]MBF6070582.1 LysE family translocator [Nocardia farcinica]MBF6138763.1 LysE family translocator [Nocardia farcinica]